MTLSKYRKEALSKYDIEKSYSLEDASKIIKDISKQKFDSTVDLAIRLGVDPRKPIKWSGELFLYRMVLEKM